MRYKVWTASDLDDLSDSKAFDAGSIGTLWAGGEGGDSKKSPGIGDDLRIPEQAFLRSGGEGGGEG